MSKIDPAKIRKDFPILSRKINGKPLVYLDNAATTQKPLSVIQAITDAYSQTNANIHRGVYALAEESTAAYENARVKTAGFINAADSSEIVFTRGATESINLVAHSWARKFLKEGDEVLLTDLEHHANIVPWYLLSKDKGIQLKSVPLKNGWELDLEAFKKLLTPKVKLVAVTAMSNVLGTITPLKEIVKLAHLNKSLVLVDGAQSVPHLKTDVQEIGCDFFVFSAHKMLGPTGVGVLWARKKLLNEMDPFNGGGEMINTVSLEKTTWADVPLKFEAGTPNYVDAAAFSASIDYLEKIGMDAIREHEKELVAYTLKKLSENPEITIYGSQDHEKQGGAISFNHKVVHAHDVGTILGEQGVAIRVGHHCAQPLMKALGVTSTARVSFYIYNTKDEIDAFAKALGKVDEVFGLTPFDSLRSLRAGKMSSLQGGAMGGVDDLYREVILEHFKSPKNKGKLATANAHADGMNPLCGDQITVSAVIDQGVIKDIKFEGQGCAISQSAASMMTAAVKGKSIADAQSYTKMFKGLFGIKDEIATDGKKYSEKDLGDLEALEGVKKYPVRVKCALLSWNTLLKTLINFEKK